MQWNPLLRVVSETMAFIILLHRRRHSLYPPSRKIERRVVGERTACEALQVVKCQTSILEKYFFSLN